ncbi:hypothetical protein N7495_003170 [Penicillium taxi]|uniref:uncharacterized protein n=1 Tax=Penicillium taxi TaxID=168475 RepID=UPI00254541A6|nr:uncharacterized protein N7495_003170 [Penicillium taxi]KAJ5902642.1 hypothetical protein N7495_003170 [Penicillium taxi]
MPVMGRNLENDLKFPEPHGIKDSDNYAASLWTTRQFPYAGRELGQWMVDLCYEYEDTKKRKQVELIGRLSIQY